MFLNQLNLTAASWLNYQQLVAQQDVFGFNVCLIVKIGSVVTVMWRLRWSNIWWFALQSHVVSKLIQNCTHELEAEIAMAAFKVESLPVSKVNNKLGLNKMSLSLWRNFVTGTLSDSYWITLLKCVIQWRWNNIKMCSTKRSSCADHPRQSLPWVLQTCHRNAQSSHKMRTTSATAWEELRDFSPSFHATLGWGLACKRRYRLEGESIICGWVEWLLRGCDSDKNVSLRCRIWHSLLTLCNLWLMELLCA